MGCGNTGEEWDHGWSVETWVRSGTMGGVWEHQMGCGNISCGVGTILGGKWDYKVGCGNMGEEWDHRWGMGTLGGVWEHWMRCGNIMQDVKT